MEPRFPRPQQQVLARLPSPRGARPSSPTATYSRGYPGPNRPYPEFQRRPPRTDPKPVPAPRTAIAAGILGIAGALPLALFVGAAVGLGGLWGDSSVEWWLYPLLAAPIALLWGAIELLSGRSWRLLVLACLPSSALFAYLTYILVDGDGLGLGYYTLLLALPIPASLLAVSPSVRRWVAGRRRARVANRAPR